MMKSKSFGPEVYAYIAELDGCFVGHCRSITGGGSPWAASMMAAGATIKPVYSEAEFTRWRMTITEEDKTLVRHCLDFFLGDRHKRLFQLTYSDDPHKDQIRKEDQARYEKHIAEIERCLEKFSPSGK